MARNITPALVKEFKMLDWDAEGDVSVWIKQVRTKEQGERDKLWGEFSVRRTEGIVTEMYRMPGIELPMLECYLSFEDANILEDTEAGESLVMFRKGMNRSDFNRAFGRLPKELMEEWHEAVLEQNPQWYFRIESDDSLKN